MRRPRVAVSALSFCTLALFGLPVVSAYCHSRQLMLQVMKYAYDSQIDLIRRGLPKIVVQAEYAWATNQLCRYDPYFRYKSDLGRFYVWCSIWNRFYDSNNRAWYALKYIKFVQSWKPEIHFITFRTRWTLPPLSLEEAALVESHWQATKALIQSSPRVGFNVFNFSFPTNVEILYDPERETACHEYKRHGPLDGPGTQDAESVLVALLISSVRLRKMGGNLDEIKLMLRHFVSFAFNGIRCERKEGASIRIPQKLLGAYGSKVGKLSADIINPMFASLITKEAVRSFLTDEIHSMTSYNSWGNTEYAKLTSSASVPKIYKSMDTVLADQTYDQLGSASARQLIQDGVANHWNIRNESGNLLVHNMTLHNLVPSWNVQNTSSRFILCAHHFVFSPRPFRNLSPLECCCATLCDVWLLLASPFENDSPYDKCCLRCNQAYCPGGATNADLQDSYQTQVWVPPFGEQLSYSVQLIYI